MSCQHLRLNGERERIASHARLLRTDIIFGLALSARFGCVFRFYFAATEAQLSILYTVFRRNGTPAHDARAQHSRAEAGSCSWRCCCYCSCFSKLPFSSSSVTKITKFFLARINRTFRLWIATSRAWKTSQQRGQPRRPHSTYLRRRGERRRS